MREGKETRLRLKQLFLLSRKVQDFLNANFIYAATNWKFRNLFASPVRFARVRLVNCAVNPNRNYGFT